MWVKLDDSWLEWEWHTDPNMVSVFFHLLSMAAKKDTRYQGRVIKRGQVIIGRRMLSEKTGISEQTIRTCLSRLEQTGEIVKEVTNKFTIVTICNYNNYQSNQSANQPTTNQQPTNNQPTTNQQLTTLIEYKNKDNSIAEIRARLENETINNQLWLDQASMSLHSSDVLKTAKDVMNEWELTDVQPEEWNAMHLFNHIRKKLTIAKAQCQQMSKLDAKEQRRAELKRQIINELHPA